MAAGCIKVARNKAQKANVWLSSGLAYSANEGGAAYRIRLWRNGIKSWRCRWRKPHDWRRNNAAEMRLENA